MSSHKTSQQPKQPLRKDAAENRRLLVEAAKEVFAERGFDATLHDVARQAGVGVGTVYRRFANKQELMEEIYAEQVEELETILHQALEKDPWEGLVYYLETAMANQVRDRGMAQIISGQHMGTSLFDASKDRTAPLVNHLAARAVEAGVVRKEITGTDLILIQLSLLQIANFQRLDGAAEVRADISGLYRRYLYLALESLRPHANALELPAVALTTEETHALFSLRATK